MHPSEHLEWLRESVEWFLALDGDVLAQPVTRCPGWHIDTVYDHLGRGVGIGRIAALHAAPEADVFAVLGAALPPPAKGEQAYGLFAHAMASYVALLERLDPRRPCTTYAGLGEVSFWIRRDAIELALHAGDVADALGLAFDIAPARASDAIDETIEFALPMALKVLARPAPPMCTLAPFDAPEGNLGSGSVSAASIRGSAQSVLLALWGRARIEVDGDEAVARAWTDLVEEAFRGP
jgi:uncharacterized protein (TIGR03083 family)